MILDAGALAWVIYFTWNIFTLIAPHTESSHFFVGYLVFPNTLKLFLLIAAFLLLVIGFLLFLLGGIDLARAKRIHHGLIQQRVYKVVRHPQILGLILMGLGLVFLIAQMWPEEGYGYLVRIGDLYSWLLFSLIWAIEAKWEEERLLKIMPEAYLNYQKKIPFLLPWGKSLEVILSPWINPNWRLSRRIVLWLGAYFVFLFLTSLLIRIFQLAFWTK